MFVGLEQTVQAWARSLELAQREPEGHPYRVAEMSLRLARKLGYPEAKLGDLVHGALLHDVGMLGVPESILQKPGRLEEDERALMQQHPTFARLILEPVEMLRGALEIPLHHHERWDGRGYPHGIAGDQIPLAARIFAIVDVWDSLMTDQPYRPAWEPSVVIEHLQDNRGKHFDAELVDAFLVLLAEPTVVGVRTEAMRAELITLRHPNSR